MKRQLFYSILLASIVGFASTNPKSKILHSSISKSKSVLPPTAYPVAKGSTWSFLDNGTNQTNSGWNLPTFDNSTWATGAGPLGYGDPSTTVLSFGPDTNDKFITYYFSKDVNVNLADLSDEIEFGIRKDDGFILYVNGVEILRENLPSGTIDNTTWAVNTIDGADEKKFYSYYFPKTVFQNGVNRISIEMHQRGNTSSDLGFDMFVKDKEPDYICVPGDIGCFTSINPTTQTPNLIMPIEQRFQMLFKQGTSYIDGSGVVPGNHDFTGYIPSTGITASTLGYLSVNHENSPGGVSIVDISHNNNVENPLWQVSNSRKVDMYNSALVSTSRNCSGGITPWGTVVTTEEDTSSGDANSDGYQDLGWFVEIDPLTASVRDYNNDGIQEKLYALGRMNHENIAINAAGTVAYYGEDGGTHCVYKFVPTTPNNLTAGNVYALKLDLPLSNDEPSSATATWVLVPNTTQADRNNMPSLASALGATNFNGVEDCEIGPDGMIYFTSKGKNRVYRFKDNGSTITDFETFVGGMSYPITTPTGVVTEPWADGNDNLDFDDKGNLWVVQDGGRNYIWVVRHNHRQNDSKVLIHSSAPSGSEPTGLTFTPDYKYGFFSIQHPSGSNQPQNDATGSPVVFNASAAIVFSNQINLGDQSTLSNIGFESDKLVSLYPNPTKDIVNLTFSEAAMNENVNIEVYDLTGRIVLQKNVKSEIDNQNVQINLSSFTGNQIFIFNVKIGEEVISYKVIKNN